MANSTRTKDTQNQEHQDQNMTEKAKDMANQATEKAKDVANQASEKAKGMAGAAQQKADQGAEYVGGGVRSAGEKVREYGPQSGMLGKATEAVSGTLEKTGRYLEEEGLSGMAEDVTDLIRRHPVPSVLVGIGVGFLLAQLTTSSRG